MAKKKKGKRIRREEEKIENISGIESSLGDKLYIIGAVLLFIFAFYLLTLYITNKNNDSKEEKEESIIQSEKIIVGESLNRSDKEYIVLFYYGSNEDMDSVFTEYKGKSLLPIYKVDMDDGFNRKYISSEGSNTSPSKASEFKIVGSTLIKVSDGKVVDYIEGEDSIRNYLN